MKLFVTKESCPSLWERGWGEAKLAVKWFHLLKCPAAAVVSPDQPQGKKD
jgi:hypothetical protein